MKGTTLFAAFTLVGALVSGCQSEINEPSDQGSTPAGTADHDEELLRVADMWGITDPPHVEVIREVTLSESQSVHENCVVEDGWVQNDDESFSVADDQQLAIGVSWYTCMAAYPIADRYLQPMQPEQWGMVYDHYIEDFIPCAQEHGFEVSEPPTRERFLAATESWAPVADIERELARAIGRGEFESFDDFYQTCPTTPTDDELYGPP